MDSARRRQPESQARGQDSPSFAHTAGPPGSGNKASAGNQPGGGHALRKPARERRPLRLKDSVGQRQSGRQVLPRRSQAKSAASRRPRRPHPETQRHHQTRRVKGTPSDTAAGVHRPEDPWPELLVTRGEAGGGGQGAAGLADRPPGLPDTGRWRQTLQAER